jgi:hypothetical protein
MIVEDERLVCIDHKCGAEFVVGRKPALEKQNARCCCGSELKKRYHSPVLCVLGTVKAFSEHSMKRSELDTQPLLSKPLTKIGGNRMKP